MSQTDAELFDDNFGKWLEAHGVTLHRTPVESNGFHATIDLNTLKAAILARDAAIRIDELEQLAEFEMLDGITVHGRHDRSFNDRIAQLRRESDQAKEEES